MSTKDYLKLQVNLPFDLRISTPKCDEVKYGMGLVLLVSNGMIDELEGATYDEVWPEHISNLQLVYLPINSADTRDMEYVKKIWHED